MLEESKNRLLLLCLNTNFKSTQAAGKKTMYEISVTSKKTHLLILIVNISEKRCLS